MQYGAEWQLIKCEVSVKAVRVREHVKESWSQRSRTAIIGTSACFQLSPSFFLLFNRTRDSLRGLLVGNRNVFRQQ